MDVLALRDVARGAADGPAILTDEAAHGDVGNGDLVPAWHGRPRDDRVRGAAHCLTRLKIA
jgi:hypothetical protein